MKTSKRNIGLDVLRAAAIIGVMLSHELNVWIHGIDMLSNFGSGVQLFFVLSGFLIGRIYFRSLENEHFSFWHFWRSRWWRTLPPYVAALVLYKLISLLHPAQPLRWYYALFLQNYLGITGFGPSWSLCVEEHFYLALPVIGFFVVRWLGKRSIKYVLPIAFFIPTALRFQMLATHAQLPAQWYWYTHLNFEELVAGVWLAYLFVLRPDMWARIKIAAKMLVPLSPLMLIVLPIWQPRPLAIDMLVNTFYALGYAAWVRYFYDLKWSPANRAAALCKFSIVGIALSSYSLYLTHTMIDPLFRNGFFAEWHRSAAKSMAVISITFVLGVAFYFAVERPTIVSRDKYLKRATKMPLAIS